MIFVMYTVFALTVCCRLLVSSEMQVEVWLRVFVGACVQVRRPGSCASRYRGRKKKFERAGCPETATCLPLRLRHAVYF